MGLTFIMALVRHLLTGAAGWMVAKGYADAATTEAIIGGVLALIGVGWSVAEKAKREG